MKDFIKNNAKTLMISAPIITCFLFFFIFIGVGFLVFSWPKLDPTTNWTKESAVVTESEISSRYRRRGSVYSLRIRYSYNVNGENYENSAVVARDRGTSEKVNQAQSEYFEVGDEINILVSDEDPSLSRLPFEFILSGTDVNQEFERRLRDGTLNSY
jgi:hypothetical protein